MKRHLLCLFFPGALALLAAGAVPPAGAQDCPLRISAAGTLTGRRPLQHPVTRALATPESVSGGMNVESDTAAIEHNVFSNIFRGTLSGAVVSYRPTQVSWTVETNQGPFTVDGSLFSRMWVRDNTVEGGDWIRWHFNQSYFGRPYVVAVEVWDREGTALSSTEPPVHLNLADFEATFVGIDDGADRFFPSGGHLTALSAGKADTEPPVISGLSVNPSVLWPPNHKLIPVALQYTVSDNRTPADRLTCTLSVSSSEPEDAQGDGSTSPDWVIVDARNVQLRAERSGGGDGRVYTLVVTCTDECGNSSSAVTRVTVPKSRGK